MKKTTPSNSPLTQGRNGRKRKLLQCFQCGVSSPLKGELERVNLKSKIIKSKIEMGFWTDIYYVFKREFYAVFRDHAVLTFFVALMLGYPVVLHVYL